MMHAPVPIGVAEDARGFLVSLPSQFWLVVGLRRTFPGLRAAEAAWTYRVPAGRGVGARIEAWIAEVELQVRAEARRRSWTASDAEWHGAGEPEPPRPVPSEPAEPAIITLPRKRTAKTILRLLEILAAPNALMVATISPDGVRGYRLVPSGRRLARAAAERAIALRLLVPGNDGLFGPEWSQTWRAPTDAEAAAAAARVTNPARPRRTRRPPPRGGLETAPRSEPAPAVCPVDRRP